MALISGKLDGPSAGSSARGQGHGWENRPPHLALRMQCGGVNTGVGNKEAASALRVTEGSGDEAMFGRN